MIESQIAIASQCFSSHDIGWKLNLVYNNNEQRPLQCHYPSWPSLAIFALICSRHFSQSYLSSFLKSYRSRSFFTHSSHDFLGLPFFPNFKLHNLTHLGVDVSTDGIPYHGRRLCIIISSIFTTTPTLSRRISVHQSRYTRYPDHTTIHPQSTSPHPQQ